MGVKRELEEQTALGVQSPALGGWYGQCCFHVCFSTRLTASGQTCRYCGSPLVPNNASHRAGHRMCLWNWRKLLNGVQMTDVIAGKLGASQSGWGHWEGLRRRGDLRDRIRLEVVIDWMFMSTPPSPASLCVEILTLKLMVFGGGAFGRWWEA